MEGLICAMTLVAGPVGSRAVSCRRTAALAVALLLAAAPAARADGDPASDVLPSQAIFFPYAPPASPQLRTALSKVIGAATAAGYPMKVALIESPGDLGSYPNLFNQPQRYANLLAGELPSNPHGSISAPQHLLVVMPVGIGGNNLGDKVDAALAPVKVDANAQSDGLARAAIEAVARIATANGHAVPIPAEAHQKLGAEHGSTKRKSGPALWVYIAPLALVLLGIVAAGRIVARRSRPSTD
jgi:GNAT superfamily N-acetyltransferase